MQGAMGICVNISLILTELLSCGYFIASTRRDFRASPFRRGDRTCSLAKKRCGWVFAMMLLREKTNKNKKTVDKDCINSIKYN